MERINFREVRDLGQILQDSAKFIRQNFLKILKPSLIVVFVPIIIGSAIFALKMHDLYSTMGQEYYNESFLFSSMWGMFGGLFFILIAMLLFYIVSSGYIKQYVNGIENINFNSIWPEIRKNFFKILFSGILLIIIIYIGFLLCIFPGIYLSVVLANLLLIMIIEDVGFGDAWNRSFSLIKEKWWSTFGLYFLTYIICMAVSYVAVLPVYAIMGIQMFTGFGQNSEDPAAVFESMSNVAWIMPVYFLIGLLVVMVNITVIAFKYYSLVEEKEGIGEKESIENIGT